jgi:murein DD-endopeptidase MepM/ murein hydrolase activator NlpD
VVLYADSKIRGYGKMIVIRHDGKVATIYAHNSKLLVRRGDVVKQGQKISLSGNTGRSTGPHLHFEVRRGLSPVNPLGLLPQMARQKSRKATYVASSR